MRALRAFVPCAVALVSAIAWAQTSEGVRLDYQADPRCPVDSAFVSEVHARSPRVRFSSDASRSLAVRITHTPGDRAKMSGRIELREADGKTTERSVTGATCEEVLSALGLVAALALDPLASTADAGASTTTTTTTNATSDAGTSTTSSGTTATTATTTRATDAGTEDAGARSHEDDERDVPPEKRRWSFGAGADAEAVFGVAPDALFAVPVFFEATRALGDHFGIGGALRFERTGETSIDAGAGADFTWTAGAADVCFVVRGGRVRFNGCARSHLGVIDAHGEGVFPVRSATRPWVDLGLALSLRVRLVGPFFIEVAGHLGIPLVRDRFFIEPNDTLFQASPLTAHAGGGIGFEIW